MAQGQWTEIGPNVFHRRYNPVDVGIGLVLGDSTATLIDTRNNPAEAQQLADDVHAQFNLPISAVINTHAHYDHCFGNQFFAGRGVPIYGHHLIPAHFEKFERPYLAEVLATPELEPELDWAEVTPTAPDHLLDAPAALILSGREFELIPLGPGHTDTDLAVHLPDANIWFVGDCVEQAGPPMFGSGSYPLSWPQVLRELLERVGEADLLVPGHGDPVNRDFVVNQADQLELLARTLRSAHAEGQKIAAIDFGETLHSLWPAQFLKEAAQDAYAQLENC